MSRRAWRRERWRARSRCVTGCIAISFTCGVGNCDPARSPIPALPGLDFVPVVAESRSASGTGAIEIEIGGAVLRADAGVDLAFLGKIVRLLKAT